MDIKILIVEDEFVTAHALRLLLEQRGYNVINIVSSAEEATKHIHRQQPDIVLLDIRLEGKQTGIDLAIKLKENNIAFVYLSANSNQKILEEAKKTEPYGFLVKPYREKDVLVALDIAYYRHKNSIESRLRQLEMLQHQFEKIITSNENHRQKLLSTVKVLQPYLPFDLILAGHNPSPEKPEELFGYLRTGYDEYQVIGEEKLHQYGKVHYKNLQFKSIIQSLRTIASEDIAFQKIISENFSIDSYMVFPVSLDNEQQYYYHFCSRKTDTYQQYHIELLSGLAQYFVALVPNKNTEKNLLPTLSNASLPNKTALSGAIIGSHPLLLEALDLAQQVAPFNTSVLILGESGTGKEKIAEAIHTASLRKGLLVKVNCAAIPASLIESELFGYEKGAFTGATENKKGKFEVAQGGTLFLDEIGDLSIELQVRLLRVLQQREIDPLGSNQPRKVDVRIVAATNRNLEKAVAEGSFRLDLYYRLNVFPIKLPPLRERKSDIIPLAYHFAQQFSKASNRIFRGISTEMTKAMLDYHWPGNIRELENIMERSIILNEGNKALQLRDSLTNTSIFISEKIVPESFEEVKNIQRVTERDYIIAALTKTNGRIRGDNGAATLLNIKPTTLESKMARLGIKKDDFGNRI